MDIQALISGPWDKLALYTLTKEQIEELIRSPDVTTHQGWMPARYKFPTHMHSRPQMLLVTRGTLTHVSFALSYTQSPNDILIVPAHLEHHAFVGDEELEFVLIVKAGT